MDSLTQLLGALALVLTALGSLVAAWKGIQNNRQLTGRGEESPVGRRRRARAFRLGRVRVQTDPTVRDLLEDHRRRLDNLERATHTHDEGSAAA